MPPLRPYIHIYVCVGGGLVQFQFPCRHHIPHLHQRSRCSPAAARCARRRRPPCRDISFKGPSMFNYQTSGTYHVCHMVWREGRTYGLNIRTQAHPQPERPERRQVEFPSVIPRTHFAHLLQTCHVLKCRCGTTRAELELRAIAISKKMARAPLSSTLPRATSRIIQRPPQGRDPFASPAIYCAW